MRALIAMAEPFLPQQGGGAQTSSLELLSAFRREGLDVAVASMLKRKSMIGLRSMPSMWLRGSDFVRTHFRGFPTYRVADIQDHCSQVLDDFRPDNGATRFVPSSHRWPAVPEDRLPNCHAAHNDEVIACGVAGSLIIFDASIWHGHTANTASTARRSIQGYFIPRAARSGFDLIRRMRAETLERLSPLARYVLAT